MANKVLKITIDNEVPLDIRAVFIDAVRAEGIEVVDPIAIYGEEVFKAVASGREPSYGTRQVELNAEGSDTIVYEGDEIVSLFVKLPVAKWKEWGRSQNLRLFNIVLNSIAVVEEQTDFGMTISSTGHSHITKDGKYISQKWQEVTSINVEQAGWHKEMERLDALELHERERVLVTHGVSYAIGSH